MMDMHENGDEQIECSATTLRLMLREREHTLQLAATYGMQLQESNEELHAQLRAAESALELEALATREANRRAERALAELKELQAELRERDFDQRTVPSTTDLPWSAAAAFSPLSSVSSASSRSLSADSPHFFRSTPDQNRRLSNGSTASSTGSGGSPRDASFTFKVARDGVSSECPPAANSACTSSADEEQETILYLKMRQRSLEEDVDDLKHELVQCNTMLSHSRAECADLIAARAIIASAQSPVSRGNRSSGTQSTPSLNCTAFYSAILSPPRATSRPASSDAFTSPLRFDSATCTAEPENVTGIRDSSAPAPSVIIPHRSLLQELEEELEDPEDSHDKSATTYTATLADSNLRHRRGGSVPAAIDSPELKSESGHIEQRAVADRAAPVPTSSVAWNTAFLTLLTLILLVLLFPARLCGMIQAQ